MSRIVHVKELKPQPVGTRIHLLPQSMAIINPTEDEVKLLDILNKELNALRSPNSVPCVVS